MSRQFFLFLLLVAASLFFIHACDTPPCEDTDGVRVNIGLYGVSDQKVISDTAFESLEVFPADTQAEELSDIFDSDYETMYLPLSKVSDTSIFILKFDSVTFDTLKFYYTRELKLVSHECGFDVFFDLTGAEVTTHNIDSIYIKKASIEYGSSENLKIYF